MESQNPLKPNWFPGDRESYALLLAILKKRERRSGFDLTEFPSQDDRHEICEILTDELLTSGFEGEWELNWRGSAIEDLIDIFNPYE